MRAAGVTVSTAPDPGARAGSTPSAALHAIRVKPLPFTVAKETITRHHYLHSLPGGTVLAFGVFWVSRLMGAVTLGAGPANAYRLVDEVDGHQGACQAVEAHRPAVVVIIE